MYKNSATMYINYMHINPIHIGIPRYFNTPVNKTPPSAPLPLCTFTDIRSKHHKYTTFPEYHTYFDEFFMNKFSAKMHMLFITH